MAIQIRRGTKAEWDANNSNIIAGEPAIALDTGEVFVGTGAGTYVELASKDYVDSQTGGSGLTDEAKQALLACFEKVAWINEDGQTYVDALEAALYPPANLRSISAVYTQSGVVYATDSLDSLRADLVVTATYTDSSTAVVTTYTLSGSLNIGTSTITVSYGGKTTTFNVIVSGQMTELFTSSGYRKSTTTGTITDATGGFDIASTGTASWNLYVFPNSDLPTYGDLEGHTLRLFWSIDATNAASGDEFIIAFDASSTENNDARLKQCDLAKTDYSNPDGSGTLDFVVGSSLWTGGSGTVTSSSFLRYRIYCHAGSGASAQFRVKIYDVGVLS